MATKADILDALKEQVAAFRAGAQEAQVGTVLSVGDGIARLSGLAKCHASEMPEFPGGIFGVALNLEEDTVGAVIIGDSSAIKQGDTVKATGRILSIPVSEEVLGRVIDPLGNPMDGKGKFRAKDFYPIEKIAPGVMARKGVGVPLQTGVKAIDALIPIGRGQRELIIGD